MAALMKGRLDVTPHFERTGLRFVHAQKSAGLNNLSQAMSNRGWGWPPGYSR